jgi:hypothetical protein
MSYVVTGLHFGGPWSSSENIYTCYKCNKEDVLSSRECKGLRQVGSLQNNACKDGFKTWALEWTVKYVDKEPVMQIEWFHEDLVIQTRNSSEWWTNSQDVDAGGDPVRLSNPLAPFDQPFYLIMNIAVGGDYAGPVPEGMQEQPVRFSNIKFLILTH